MPGAKELAPIVEFPLPLLEVDVGERIIKMGQRGVVFQDNPRWDLLLHLFQNPNTPIPTGEVFKTMLRGKADRQIIRGWNNLSPSSQVKIINNVFAENLGFSPISLSGAGRGVNYCLKAEVQLTNGNIKDHLPEIRFMSRVEPFGAGDPQSVPLDKRRVYLTAPTFTERERGVPDTTDPHASLLVGLPLEQLSFAKRLLKDGKVSRDTAGSEVVPELNDRLREEYVTVVGNDFVVRKINTRVRSGVVDRTRVR